MKNNTTGQFMVGVTYIVNSYLCSDGDINDIPALLRQVADDYEKKIEEESEE